MVNNNYIGTYKGLEIYRITLDDFLNLTSAEQNTKEKIHLITNDRQVITNGKVFGTVTNDNKRLDTRTALPWQVVYAVQLAKKNELKKREEEKKQRKIVVTERPTVENLAKVGEEKLQEIQHDAADALDKLNLEALEKTEEVLGDATEGVAAVENKVEEVVAELTAESEAKLTALADEGEKQVAAVKKRKPRVKTTTTAE